ncbi:MAG TPA: hypothetical protein VGJ20_31530 [Xanthobacteraceae bacterium]|jgi:hypothetical protein
MELFLIITAPWVVVALIYYVRLLDWVNEVWIGLVGPEPPHEVPAAEPSIEDLAIELGLALLAPELMLRQTTAFRRPCSSLGERSRSTAEGSNAALAWVDPSAFFSHQSRT